MAGAALVFALVDTVVGGMVTRGRGYAAAGRTHQPGADHQRRPDVHASGRDHQRHDRVECGRRRGGPHPGGRPGAGDRREHAPADPDRLREQDRDRSTAAVQVTAHHRSDQAGSHGRRQSRSVITATQRKPLGLAFSAPYYVTVDSLQPGPSRGPVGSVDCSDRPIEAGAPLQRCDLTGAVLTQAALPNTNLQHADLSGADLSRANVSIDNMAGAWLGGANLSNTHSANVSLLNAVAPGLNISGTSTLTSDNFGHAQLQGSNFLRCPR